MRPADILCRPALKFTWCFDRSFCPISIFNVLRISNGQLTNFIHSRGLFWYLAHGLNVFSRMFAVPSYREPVKISSEPGIEPRPQDLVVAQPLRHSQLSQCSNVDQKSSSSQCRASALSNDLAVNKAGFGKENKYCLHGHLPGM